ncbi:putative invertase inhibitor [Triticum dicoccoides]|uniref:Pectinesterase inhibitor domain-containing protein n=1 Tax=Triticum turgidum subsp. durum TaxID=4567 RepID=A0A9R0Z0I2_TRITD|nr:putative invertase inhibitor [Triticum dicoccoides]VAI63808.1 unnamed protein product [Triticum turgidum subsp. durum]
MRRRWQALSFCLVILLFTLVSSSASTLQDTCKTVAVNNKDIGYDYCIKFFQANNASATADKRGLGDIATEISRAAALDIGKRIDTLMASEKDKTVHGRLSDCRVLYSAAVNMLKSAANLNAVISGTDTCEQGFRVLGVTSQLAADDADFIKDCSIALIITSSLL